MIRADPGAARPDDCSLRVHWSFRYEGEAEDLGITFSVEDDVLGRRQVHELCPGGDDMAVTSSNKLLYVHLVADWHLNRRLGKPAASFAAGLNQVNTLPSMKY